MTTPRPPFVGLPSADQLLQFYLEVDKALNPVPEWLPCRGRGCCTGDDRCCREDMATSITWWEMEGLWEFVIRHWTATQRRAVAARAKAQMDAVFAANPLALRLTGEETMSLLDLKQIEATLQTVEHSCPMLERDAEGHTHGCAAYAVRPLICRGFGQTVRLVNSGRAGADGRPVTEPAFSGCDLSFEAARAHPDQGWVNYSGLEQILLNVVAPRLGGFRAPLVAKPIPAWLVDLTDETGGLNPRDIFNSIRAMIRQAADAVATLAQEPAHD